MERDPMAIVVVNYGSHELLGRNLVRVAGQVPGTTVVVVDNFSTAKERQEVVQLAGRHGWQVVLPATNVGFGAGMNAGVARARSCGARYFLLLNPDAVIDGDSIALLHERVVEDPMLLVAPVVQRPDGSTEFDGAEVRLRDGSMRSARSPRRSVEGPGEPWLTGACLLVADQLWERVGGFAEDYFLYWEDVDLSRRARSAGARLEVEPAARAVHDEGGTQRRAQARAKSSAYYYFNTRNRLLYAAHHLSVEGQRRWLVTAPAAARDILLRGGRRQFLKHPTTPLWAAWRGTWHGMRLMRAARRGKGVAPGRPDRAS